ncbi:thioesterase family protein [Ensifer sp. B1-9]|uniref:thioesterase family protein n=1 Tax=Ensifer sp. B1-9 TaxID=3141455 RepID=UPI003D23F0E6
MISTPLLPGLTHRQTIVIGEHLTVPAVSSAFTGFADMPPVFATAFLVGFVEWTCIEALRPYLSAGQRTVGVHVDLSHSAATPVGMAVTADVKLLSFSGRALRFGVTCRDEVEVISQGYHDRFLVETDRFMARVARKAAETKGAA